VANTPTLEQLAKPYEFRTRTSSRAQHGSMRPGRARPALGNRALWRHSLTRLRQVAGFGEGIKDPAPAQKRGRVLLETTARHHDRVAPPPAVLGPAEDASTAALYGPDLGLVEDSTCRVMRSVAGFSAVSGSGSCGSLGGCSAAAASSGGASSAIPEGIFKQPPGKRLGYCYRES